MKAGKIIILIFLALFGIVLILGAIGPKKVSVERSITIDQPVSMVFKYATNYNHTLEWNPWMDQDPKAKHTYTGKPGKKGSRWTWEGEKIGKGYLEIQKVIPNQRVVSELKFIEPWESLSKDIRKFEETASGTKVTWITTSELSFPIERIVGFFMEGMMGGDLEQGLKNLKAYCDKQARLAPVFKTIEIEGMTCNGCEKTIEKEITKLPGVLSVEASHQKGLAKVKVDSSRFNQKDYEKAIEGVGYKMLGVKKP